jgi:N4-gp56 family major capsid protein
MATTDYPVNHPNARKHWANEIHKEALKRTYALKFMSAGPDNIIQVRNETSKSGQMGGKGDLIRYPIKQQLQGDGIQGDATLETNEEALVTYYDEMYINQLRHATRSAGQMSEQRVPYDVREEGMDSLADWYATRYDVSFFNQICSHYQQTDTKYTGNNAAITASGTGNRIFYGHSTTASLTASATGFGLTAIDRCVEIAQTRQYPIRPIKMNGGEYYVMFIRPETFTALKGAVSASAVTWYDVQRSLLESGLNARDNPLLTGAAGMYANTIIHVAPNIPRGVTTEIASAGLSVVPAVFCGAQAVTCSFGVGYGQGSPFTWAEELFDYGNQLGIACGSIFGMKKNQFNGQDHSVIQVLHTISTTQNMA